MNISKLLADMGIEPTVAIRKMDEQAEYAALVHDIDAQVEQEMKEIGVEPLEGRA